MLADIEITIQKQNGNSLLLAPGLEFPGLVAAGSKLEKPIPYSKKSLKKRLGGREGSRNNLSSRKETDWKALDFLEKLPKELRKRIFNKTKDTKENPMHFFEQLEGRKDFRLRVGDYRLIADIDHNLKRIDVTLIDHRKRVYKHLPKEK